MLKIVNIRGEEHYAGPGMSATDCEMEVALVNENDYKVETYYVHASYCIGVCFTVAKESCYDMMIGEAEYEDVEFLEQYESLHEAANSKFFNCIYHLNLFASNLNSDFARSDIRNQIKTIESGANAEVLEDDLFSVRSFNKFQHGKRVYTAEVNMKVFIVDMFANLSAMESVELNIIDENGKAIEEYEDIELAAGSKYFLILCDLWTAFIDKIKEFIDNADEETAKQIHEYVDLPDLDPDYNC